ncbi:MAG: hypothetical protein CR981_04855 [Proteobacteria bacterium]|nr:MAG: hypothetical protein CR981_04855 [Pseudomonadota bacterium]
MSESISHHLVYGTLKDFLTGEDLPDTDDERIRQQISRLMVEERGYFRQELEPRCFIETCFNNCFVRSVIDLTVCLENRQVMIIRYGAGSLVSRERAALAAARLLNRDYRIPLAVVTNGENSLLLDTVTASVTGEGMSSLPDRQTMINMMPSLLFLPPQEKEKRERERRILNTFDLDRCCRS